MFAVRRALSAPERLKEFVAVLVEKGELDPADIDTSAPLDLLLRQAHSFSLPDAAYRFCRDEPGVHVVLSGTGNIDHLKSNLQSFSRPPLPADAVERLRHIFRKMRSTTGQQV